MYLYLDPICAKAGEGDLNRYMYKLMLLITIIIIIINLNFSFLFFFNPIKTTQFNKDNIVHKRHFSSVMTTRVQKMSHALMYLYLNPTCAKAGEWGLQWLMYKRILLIITTTTKCQCTVQFIILRGVHLYRSDILPV